MRSTQPIAHVRQDSNGSWQVHDLAEHLSEVSRLAGNFAEAFGCAEWASLAGQWHDLGKYRPAFQHYICAKSGYDPQASIEGRKGRVDHSTAGAINALDQFGPHGRLLAYLISGHHTGLPDYNNSNASLFQRLENPDAKTSWLEAIAQQPITSIRQAQRPGAKPPGGAKHLWLRLLFSCLVDADFLDTEKFMDPDKSEQRRIDTTLAELLDRFNAHMTQKCAQAENHSVNQRRAEVLRQCRAQAKTAPGLFSLTVPTGGGKTLSSLAFALNHAVLHNRQRIIYAIPYTSIIEQTADIFRGIFGDNVIEHHSNLDPEQETVKSRLATENWDAPLIVTTNVQLFESLFAARTSKCRKLHNIVNSIIILDEAQLLPPDFLDPILAIIRDLSTHYGVTFVFSTATQPAFKPRQGFGWTFNGLDNIREIISEPDTLYRDLARVKVHLPDDLTSSQDFAGLAGQISEHKQALVIVNSRGDARELAKLLPQAIHLSANLCGKHRSRLIRYIKWRLKKGCALCVISTQLIEAGVDVDFPVVYRALAGLDSIAQAAGRCNREGCLNQGDVYLFIPPKSPPAGLLRKGADAAKQLLLKGLDDPLARTASTQYFELYYAGLNSRDKQNIQGLLCKDERSLQIQFRTAADLFQLIDDEAQQAVIVRYADAEKWLNLLKKQGPERWLMRKLQRYIVNIPKSQWQKSKSAGEIDDVYEGIYAQVVDGVYHPRFGFVGGSDAINNAVLIG